MNYAEWHREHKAYWDEESQRSGIDRALTGHKAPTEEEAVSLLKRTSPGRQKEKPMEENKEAIREYYATCAFPKEGEKKKKKRKQNGWKGKARRRCRYTGQPYAERHELFYGNGLRRISIDLGFQVDLCPPIHRLFHGIVGKAELEALNVPGMFPDPKKWAAKEAEELRRGCQESWEAKQTELGITPEEARARWIELIGQNYL
ncbi:MAG: hypothetical protein HFE75_11465 [Firmicutes bacterium]|jgi:hypothetical protein|nr:hypothetical protein [Bacillota bacterium]